MIKPVNAKGLSVQQVQELQEKLTLMAKENVGEVMIMEIGKGISFQTLGQLEFKRSRALNSRLLKLFQVYWTF